MPSLMSMARKDLAARGFMVNAKGSGSMGGGKGSLGKRKESPVKGTKMKKRKSRTGTKMSKGAK